MGVALTIASAWLPCTLFSIGSPLETQGRRLSVPADGLDGEFELGARRVWRPLNTWVYLSGRSDLFDDPHGVNRPQAQRDITGPKPEQVLRGWSLTDAWPQFLSFRRQVRSQIVVFQAIEMRGWPARAVWCDYDTWAPAPTTRGALVIPGVHLAPHPLNAVYPRTLPYWPIWSGLAINVLFWSIVAATPIHGLRVVRRRVRRLRGRCLACGYELVGISAAARCPECGRSPVPGGHR